MTDSHRRAMRWIDLIIFLATIAMADALVRWADREYLRVEPPSQRSRPSDGSRPDWLLTWLHPYRRLQHDWFWFCVAATVGAGALLAVDGRTWTRRGRARPGTMVVFVSLLVGGVTAAHHILIAPPFGRPNGLSYSLLNALEFRMPGAILGVWVVTWLRPWRGSPDPREHTARIVGWIWMANVGLLVGYGLLFG